MQSYLIEPMAPLVFRSGKPFAGPIGADGANFPLPSSAAGLMRTVAADQKKQPFSEELRQQAVRGPLLVRYDSPEKLNALVPKPADALYLKGENGEVEIVRLQPAALPEHCGSDLPDGLLPVQMAKTLKGKPVSGPQYWALADLTAWQGGKNLSFQSVRDNGLESLPSEQRTHVALDPETLASDDGRLFQTSGLDLQAAWQPDKHKWSDTRLGFLAQTTAELKNGLVTFGGERRMSRLEKLSAKADWTCRNAALTAEVRKAGGLRLTLITPAIFAGGYLPGWLDASTLEGTPPSCPGLRVKLQAVAIDRWVPVSGWDLAAWKPKAMRKAVAAGAVYWFSVIGEAPDNLESLWLAPLSDDSQDNRDGFGMATAAAWQPVQA